MRSCGFTNWDAANTRRHNLIDKKLSKRGLTRLERQELAELQTLAGMIEETQVSWHRTMAKLQRLKRKLQREGKWVGE